MRKPKLINSEGIWGESVEDFKNFLELVSSDIVALISRNEGIEIKVS